MRNTQKRIPLFTGWHTDHIVVFPRSFAFSNPATQFLTHSHSQWGNPMQRWLHTLHNCPFSWRQRQRGTTSKA